MAESPKGIYELLVHCKDVQASVAFYEGVLGLHRVREEAGLVWLGAGQEARMVQVLLHPWDAPTPAPYGIVVEFEYDNVDVVVERARHAGYAVVQPPTDLWFGVREACVQDPDGHNIWLTKPLVTPEDQHGS
jgi:catechol 2,3-dioxygenase-like lactoylglutathione lyase family enzyme